MRIAIDAINANRTLRGPDRYLLGLLRALAGLDENTIYIVFHAPWQTWCREAFRAPNVEWVEVRAPAVAAARIPWKAVFLPSLMARYKPDVIHLPNTILLLQTRFPVVMTIHDLAEYDFPEKFSHFRAGVRRVIGRLAARRASRIVTVSEYTKESIVRVLGIPDENVTVHPEGVEIGDAGENPSRVRKTHQLTRSFFLYVGVIEKTKNVEGILRAYAALSPEIREDYDVVLVGRAGNASGDVMRLREELGLTERVHCVGHVSESDLAAFFLTAFAFVFPSLVEGFGLAVLEAMAYGLPVVAARAAAVPEVVGDAGLLVAPGNDAELSAALTRLVTTPSLRSELIGKGFRQAQKFSWDEAARRMLGEYRAIGSAKSGPTFARGSSPKGRARARR